MGSSNNNDDGNAPPKKGSDASAETVRTLDSLDLDAHKLQTAEELTSLIELMQAEFRTLRDDKVSVEMRAERLQTELASSQQEKDAEFVRLSEEADRWRCAAQQERVPMEGLRGKAKSAERCFL